MKLLKDALEASDDEESGSRTVKYVMNPVPEGKGLRFRLTAVGGYNDVIQLKQNEIVLKFFNFFF